MSEPQNEAVIQAVPSQRWFYVDEGQVTTGGDDAYDDDDDDDDGVSSLLDLQAPLCLFYLCGLCVRGDGGYDVDDDDVSFSLQKTLSRCVVFVPRHHNNHGLLALH